MYDKRKENHNGKNCNNRFARIDESGKPTEWEATDMANVVKFYEVQDSGAITCSHTFTEVSEMFNNMLLNDVVHVMLDKNNGSPFSVGYVSAVLKGFPAGGNHLSFIIPSVMGSSEEMITFDEDGSITVETSEVT